VASRGGLSALALAEISTGVILAWSGIENASLSATLTSIQQGKAPKSDTGTEQVTPDVSTAPTGSPAGGAITTVPGGKTVSPAEAYAALRNAGLSASVALILTAVGGAESGWNVNALNNDPATGDYSVGVWQINYYGDLMSSRTAEFGAPSALIGNLAAQAAAAAAIYHDQGLPAWTTYTRGTYAAYLPQAAAAAAGP
jgi:Lysozyme like domain